MTEPKIKYEQLDTGYEFAPSVFRMEADTVKAYNEAVSAADPIYRDNQIVPPMAIAALAMRAMADSFELLPGTVHVSQQLGFKNTVKIGEELTSRARVSRKVVRGKFHMLNIGLNITNEQDITVMTGEVGFILPLS